MSAKQAQILMAVVILTRSSAYIFSKTGLETLGMFNLLAARFLLAFLVLGVIFFKRLRHISRHDLMGGAIIGAVFTGVMAFELTALKTTDLTSIARFFVKLRFTKNVACFEACKKVLQTFLTR